MPSAESAPDAPRCADCKRRLLRPSPSGYGPVCERRRNARPVARASPPAPSASPVPPVEGQTELPLTDQPTLWSL